MNLGKTLRENYSNYYIDSHNHSSPIKPTNFGIEATGMATQPAMVERNVGMYSALSSQLSGWKHHISASILAQVLVPVGCIHNFT